MNTKLRDVPTGEQLYADHAGKYYRDGNTVRSVYASLADPATAQPYCVRLARRGWIPVNHLVHGSSEAEALERCVETLRYCAEHSYNNPRIEEGPHSHNVLEQLNKGLLLPSVQPIDKLVICHLEWSANGF